MARKLTPPPAPTPMTLDQTLEQRGSQYGPFRGHAAITQGLKDMMRGVYTPETNWAELSHSQKEALEMIVHKIGRILNGNPNHVDSWTDIAGYARLVERELLGEEV